MKYAQRIFRNFRQISELTGFFDEKFLQSMRKGKKMALTDRAGRAGNEKNFHRQGMTEKGKKREKSGRAIFSEKSETGTRKSAQKKPCPAQAGKAGNRARKKRHNAILCPVYV